MLSPVEVERYERDGYLVPDFRLPGETIESIKADHARLDMVAQLIGPDIALWNSSRFAKPARVGTRTPWHQDGEYWPIHPLATCTVWIALDASTRENGCLRFLPGTHRGRTLTTHHHNDAKGNALALELDAEHVDESKAVDVELQPGQISLHDVYLMHGSEPNTSGRPRRAMTLRFMPATSVYHHDHGKYAADAQRTLFLMRGTDLSGQNDFRLR